jgi:ubiquinone/menaquinone biosynthesis C-methylase UbiE
MTRNLVSTEAYYDHIARDYNGLMTESDNHVREQVKGLFKTWVSSGIVLDFGGGTGLDLPWLVDYSKVYFLEPSVGMRAVARKNTVLSEQASKISFAEENVFTQGWSASHLPFPEKMNGILMNFAVMNCVEKPQELFEKISLVCHPSCRVVATIINPSLKSAFKNYSWKSVLTLYLTGRLATRARHGEYEQKAYVHTVSSLVRASRKDFELLSCVSLGSSDFSVLIFSRR